MLASPRIMQAPWLNQAKEKQLGSTSKINHAVSASQLELIDFNKFIHIALLYVTQNNELLSLVLGKVTQLPVLRKYSNII